ncbi:MAG: phenylacetic acid degradation operon negative regulatory protein PaaX [Gemmatimonadetes bacterium]|nr:phenylacetic acid degradation operon negative regulatory protein PaaX [Gemmatimonadota bacterium]
MSGNGSTQRPQDLVFTLYGEYLLHRDDPIWVGSLISLLQPFGLSEGAVRTVLSRMARKGWLDAHRLGKNAFYDLTLQGRHLLEEGQAKIFHPPWDTEWDGSWFLLSYSIPEDVRQLRDRLRDRLAWLGFGSLGNGLWISPHDVEERVTEISGMLGINQHLECFRATRVRQDNVSDLVEKCWNLPAIDARYIDFTGRWQREMDRCRAGVSSEDVTPEECFTLRFDLIHEFRVFPLEDPYLPRTLLPEDWHGDAARVLFQDLHDLLEGPADRYVDEILAVGPPAPGLPQKR